MERKVEPDGTVFVAIYCGCCAGYFYAPLGGTCFCETCINNAHPNCRRKEIMGIKE